MFGELLSKSNLLRGSQTELSDLINQRGINSDFNITLILNDERNDERSQEIAAAYSKFFCGFESRSSHSFFLTKI